MKRPISQETEKEPPEDDTPDDPLDLTGFETMQKSFGKGSSRRTVLVSKPITLNQLVSLSK